MATFVNRERELAWLRSHFDAGGAELLVVYGRRRVGKTVLLQRFCRERPVVYHMAARTTPADELGRLSARLAEFFDDALLRVQPLASWEAVFSYLGGRSERFGLVLDEFPYEVEGTPSLPSLLQRAWDLSLRDTGLRLVLCGSSVAMMERTLLSPAAPLHGRRTGQWRVEPFGVRDVQELLGCTLVEAVEAHAVMGGVPMYLRLLDPARLGPRLVEQVAERVLSKGELLYDEVVFLLREELREPRVYQAILAAAAAGATRFGEIASRTGLGKANLTRYLAQLADLGLLRREVPVTERLPHKSRKGRYLIADPFVRFWYRFAYPNLHRLELQGAPEVARTEVAPHLDHYVGQVCEPVIADLLASGALGPRVLPFEVAHAGRHWSRTEELDLVFLSRERDRALVGEIKWTGGPIAPGQTMAALRRKTARVPALAEADLTHAIISRAGFATPPEPEADERYIDLGAPEPAAT